MLDNADATADKFFISKKILSDCVFKQYSSWRKKNPCEENFFIFPIFRKQNNLLIFFTNEFQLRYGFIYRTIAFLKKIY